MDGRLITDEPETLNLFCGVVRGFLFVDFNGSELVMADEANKGVHIQFFYYFTNLICY